MNFPKKQGQRLIPEHLLDYATQLQNSHPDPTESWGGGSEYTAGDGIDINDNVISVDNTIAKKSEIPSLDGYATQTWVQEQGYSTFSGSYNDLTDKPTIPTDYVTTDTIQTINVTKYFSSGTLVVDDGVYTLSHYTDMFKFAYGNGVIDFELPTNKPKGTISVPAKYTLATIDDIPNVPTLATVATTGSYNDLIDKPTFATVATSGSYNDLTDKPVIPDTSNFVTTNTDQTISGTKTFKDGALKVENTLNCRTMTYDGFGCFDLEVSNQGTIERSIFELPTYKPRGTEQEYTQYTLATLDDIHNPTITFTQGGTTKGTITLNQSGDQTIEFDAGGGGGSSAPFEISNMEVNSSNQTITLTIVATS